MTAVLRLCIIIHPCDSPKALINTTRVLNPLLIINVNNVHRKSSFF